MLTTSRPNLRVAPITGREQSPDAGSRFAPRSRPVWLGFGLGYGFGRGFGLRLLFALGAWGVGMGFGFTVGVEASLNATDSPEGALTVLSDPLRVWGTLWVGGVPADTGTVVLHRVRPEGSGAIDSLRVNEGGRFEFEIPFAPLPGTGELYFASARHEGVLYFGGALSTPEQFDEPYDIRAFPLRPVGTGTPRFRVAARNLFIEEGPQGWRVTDVFEVLNEDEVTWGPDEPGGTVWGYPLPAEAWNVVPAEGDAAPGSLRLDRGAVEQIAPFPPGPRLIVIRYDLPSLAFTLPLPGRTEIFELLIKEPVPPHRVEGLIPAEPVEIERGSLYQRWWGEDLLNVNPRIQLGEATEFPMAGVAALLAALLVGAGSWLVLKRPGQGPERRSPTPAPTAHEASRKARIRRIAELDEALAQGQVDPAEAQAERTRLLHDLEKRA